MWVGNGSPLRYGPPREKGWHECADPPLPVVHTSGVSTTAQSPKIRNKQPTNKQQPNKQINKLRGEGGTQVIAWETYSAAKRCLVVTDRPVRSGTKGFDAHQRGVGSTIVVAREHVSGARPSIT